MNSEDEEEDEDDQFLGSRKTWTNEVGNICKDGTIYLTIVLDLR